MSAHYALASPELERMVTIEIEPAMIEGSRHFYPANRRVFDDPRSVIVNDDAKSYFAASNESFDFIFSEPSNPWVSGVSSLFTVEFYERVSQYLAPGGVFGQWIHLYEIDDRLVLTILAAMHHVFPDWEAFLTADTDMLIVATNDARLPEPDWELFQSAGLQQDLCQSLPLTPRMLEASRLASRRAFAALLDHSDQVNSDFYPVLDLGAERTRFLGHVASGLINLSSARFDITAPSVDRRSLPTEELVAPIPSIARMRALAVSALLRDPQAELTLAEEERDGSLTARRYAIDRWQASISGDRPPADWRRWLESFATIEQNLHGGLQGVVDERFYREARAYLNRVDTPDAVRHVVDFREGRAAWEFEQVVRSGNALLAGVKAREGWISAGEFLDGFTVAALELGEARLAYDVFRDVAKLTGRPPTDLTMHLLRARIFEAGTSQTLIAEPAAAAEPASLPAAPAARAD
jgi:hypothetical protein